MRTLTMLMDDPDDSAELRARAEAAERRLMVRRAVIGRRWQQEILEKR
jgi:hypothetical protein